jgi:mono/diheme cytochrome c family protein
LLVYVGACGKSDTKSSATLATPASGAWTVTGNDPRAALFLQKGCPQCHTISALGIKSTAEVGPDLTTAYADVRTRFGVSLEEFVANPTGTMQMVLSSMIQLSPAERDSVVHVLKQLHEEQPKP